MAAPADLNSLDISGTYVLNKSLSDTTEMDTILKHQGVGWIVRSAIGYATITIIVKHYKDEAGIEHIDIDQSLSGGVGASNERRTMDWTYRETQDNIFGAVKGKSRRIKVEDIQDEYLQKGWLPDVLEHGAINSYVESDTEKSKKHWIAEQIWGFEEIGGERRYVRHVKFQSDADGSNLVKAIMAYDYTGPPK